MTVAPSTSLFDEAYKPEGEHQLQQTRDINGEKILNDRALKNPTRPTATDSLLYDPVFFAVAAGQNPLADQICFRIQ